MAWSRLGRHTLALTLARPSSTTREWVSSGHQADISCVNTRKACSTEQRTKMLLRIGSSLEFIALLAFRQWI